MDTTIANPDFAAAISTSPRLQRLIWKGKFGLETERIRVDRQGRLATTPHPAGLGNKSDHPFITTDFSESQIELITPPMDTLEETRGFLQTALNVVRSELPAEELLWPQSMPPVLPELDEEIPLARFDGDGRGRTEYREQLAKIYGRARQTICGSHFNFSFAPEFFESLSSAVGEPVPRLKERVYLKIMRNLMRERWVLVGLLGRSPIAHESLRLKSLDSEGLARLCCDFGVSIRCSKIGYRNRHPFVTDYCCLERYTADVAERVRQGKLLNPNELYLPIRLKMEPDGATISHLEFRIMDLDPFDATGVSLSSLRLLHLFALYSLVKDEEDNFGEASQARADALHNEAACCGLSGERTCGEIENGPLALQGEALAIIDAMKRNIDERVGVWPQDYVENLKWFRRHAEIWDEHPATALKEEIQRKGFVAFHLERAQAQEAELAKEAFRFHAFPNLELSTQLLLKAAVRRGIEFDVLDRKSNFIRLRKGVKREYVVQATKTSLDRYSQVLAMQNKKVTKRILKESGISTPGGADFSDRDEARAAWELFRDQPVVVKPMNTNFGIGITILKSNGDPSAFEHAVDTAFAEDEQILVEPFIAGKEYRFFLIKNQVVAVLHRVPANVVGDGVRSIRELVEQKNRDPLRGKGYRTPLERIQLGQTEERFLREQGLGFESTPAAGERVFLRENSNISTGGDSIDYTDRAHPSYARIASAASQALQVSVVGLDLMAQDIEAPATLENHSVIELNFNPAIHIHCHPFQGENRKLDERILSALGFL